MKILDRISTSVDTNWAGRGVSDVLAIPTRRRIPAIADRVGAIALEEGRRPGFSVIIPCYNYGRFLGDAVKSVLEQNDVEVQVIIVDDASTDNSANVAEGLAGDRRVMVLRNSVNQGHVRAFNNGYERAELEFVVRLDADDLLTPGSLSRAGALFDAFPTVGLVYGHPRHFRTSIPPAAFVDRATWTIWDGEEWLAERCRKGFNCITTPEAVVRASLMNELGPLDTKLRFAQDMEMWLRVSGAADVGRINGPDQALHRDHPTSMSETSGSGIEIDLDERRTVFELVMAKVGANLRDEDSSDRAWRDALANEALTVASLSFDRGFDDAGFVDDMVEFARNTHSDPTTLSGWATLERLRDGRARSGRWMPASLKRRLADRTRREYFHAVWTRTGL